MRAFKVLREKIDAKIIRFCIAISTFSIPFMDKSVAYAGDKTFDFLKDGATDNNAFSKLKETAEQTGYSLYKLMMVIGVIGLVVCFIALGLNYAFSHNSSNKGEKKSRIADVLIGGIIVFGALSLVGLIKSIADNLA